MHRAQTCSLIVSRHFSRSISKHSNRLKDAKRSEIKYWSDSWRARIHSHHSRVSNLCRVELPASWLHLAQRAKMRLMSIGWRANSLRSLKIVMCTALKFSQCNHHLRQSSTYWLSNGVHTLKSTYKLWVVSSPLLRLQTVSSCSLTPRKQSIRLTHSSAAWLRSAPSASKATKSRRLRVNL